jgi:hypothetical protein
MIQLDPIETAAAPASPPGPPPRSPALIPIQMRITHAQLVEVLTMLAVLRDYVSVTVLGDRPETYLFERGSYVGPAEALARLRARLISNTPVDVTLTSHSSLAGLFGPPIPAIALVLDPADKLGA